MPNRLIHLLLLAASLSASGAAIVALSNGALSSRQFETKAAKPLIASPVADTLDASMTLLPVVVVHPEPEVPTLATVTVRPSRADMAEVIADAGATPVGPILPPARPAAVPSVAGAGWDMPCHPLVRARSDATAE